MPTSCYGCGAVVRIDGPVGRRSVCPECDADLHCCMDCRHYDEAAAHQCREPHAEQIVDKEASNACDLFQLGDGASRRRGSDARAARNALGALFGDAPRDVPNPRDELEALFKPKK
jgi:predicted anti-sigma-YlaC factor YlaD